MPDTTVRAWEWRKAAGGWTTDADRGPRGRAFHAYDVNDNAACQVSLGLMATCEEPNEGSHFCEPCMEFVRLHPEGRAKRVYDADGRLIDGTQSD